jgi:NAD(P)-dependent dehydrogenase (short-subunit alcohol dehydrogenase family)
MTTPRVTSPFGFESTAAEVIAGIDRHDRRALVTGAASGIGVETARALASAGAETVIAARNLAAAERAAADIRATTGNPAVSAARLDLLDRGSVDRLARDLAGPLHILVNNAGMMAVPELRRTRKDTSCSSRPTTSATSASQWGCCPALRAQGGRGSAPGPT